MIGLIAYESLDHRIRPVLVIAVFPAELSVLIVLAVREKPTPKRETGPRAGPDVRQRP